MVALNVVASTAAAMIFAVNSGAAIAKPGDPIPDIDVVIGSKPDGKVVQQIKTDAQGNFTSGVLPKGTYVLTFRPPPITASAPSTASAAPNAAPMTRTMSLAQEIAVEAPGGRPIKGKIVE